MFESELQYYAELLGRDRPEVKRMIQNVYLNPQNYHAVKKHMLLTLRKKGFDLSELPLFGPGPANRPGEGIYAGDIIFGDRISGRLLLPVEAFAEHTLVTGHSGAGKSFLIRMLVPQFAEREISVWIFDSEKEYRSLLKK